MNRSLTFIANELNIQGTFYSDESLAAEVFKAITGLKGEVARLKEGKFTDEELQNLCHNLDDSDYEKFCDGCDEHQRKLFWKCRSDVFTKLTARTIWGAAEEALKELKDPERLMQLEETERKFIQWKKLVHDTLDELDIPKFENEQCRIKPRLQALKDHVALLEVARDDGG